MYGTLYRMQHSRSKRPPKIGDAVFRGQKSAYEFQVFPLTDEIADTPAVFFISRRSKDKLGAGASKCRLHRRDRLDSIGTQKAQA